MAEPVAVVPMDARLICYKGNRGRLLRAYFHGNTMIHQAKTMGHVLNFINVRDNHSYFITLVNCELRSTKGRRIGCHVNTNLVPLTDNLVICFKNNPILFSHFTRGGKKWIVTLPNFSRMNLVAARHDTIVRLSKRGAIVHQSHDIT